MWMWPFNWAALFQQNGLPITSAARRHQNRSSWIWVPPLPILFTDLNNYSCSRCCCPQCRREGVLLARSKHCQAQSRSFQHQRRRARPLFKAASGRPARHDDLGIRNNLIGLITRAIPTTAKCCAQSLLMNCLSAPTNSPKHKKPHAPATMPCLRSTFSKLCVSTPITPAFLHDCRRLRCRQRLTARHIDSQRHQRVGVNAIGNVMNACSIPPTNFALGRPEYQAMMWGYGMHTRFGQYINRVQIPAF